jgi:ABC-2 type transport system ATP-binding protein
VGSLSSGSGAAADRVLDVTDLCKLYRSRSRGEVRALDDVSFSVGRGEIVGLLGANGAGKTTTIKSICGLVTPTSGEIAVNGVDAVRSRRQAARHLTAVLEGNRTVYWRLNVRENLEYFAALRGRRASEVRSDIDELVVRFNLVDKAETPAMQLSRGMQQKLALACAVLPRTPLLLLDEPTLGLDVETSHELRGYLRRLAIDDGRTILLSSHDMQVVRDVCDRVVIINGGRVVADDTISGLVKVFKARSCRVRLAAPLDVTTRGGLESQLDVVRSVDESTVEVVLRDGAEFYRLFDVLRSGGCEIEAVESVEPDLEEVFLNIVKGVVPQ